MKVGLWLVMKELLSTDTCAGFGGVQDENYTLRFELGAASLQNEKISM